MNKIPLNKKKIEELIKLLKHYNIFPIHLQSYIHKKKHPIYKIFNDLLNETKEYYKIISDDEIKSITSTFPSWLKMMANDSDKKENIAFYYLVSQIQIKFYSLKNSITNNIKDSKVVKLYPELLKKIDGDGLLELNDDFEILDGGIIYKDHILHYNQFLRRNYTSNPNFDFLIAFISNYNKNKNINKFRIAIDFSRIMLKEYYTRIYEFDTWYGAPFDEKKLDDKNEVGLTIIKRNKDSLFELTNHLDRTEFYWSYKSNIKTFEIEEICDPSELIDSYFINKYLHSERDIINKNFRHLDGAVKIYLKDSYSKRFETNIPNEFKSFKKIKLFRIDGNIDFIDWIDLITYFYKSNEMIIEYFNPDKFNQIFEERIRDFKKWKDKQ